MRQVWKVLNFSTKCYICLIAQYELQYIVWFCFESFPQSYTVSINCPYKITNIIKAALKLLPDELQ